MLGEHDRGADPVRVHAGCRTVVAPNDLAATGDRAAAAQQRNCDLSRRAARSQDCQHEQLARLPPPADADRPTPRLNDALGPAQVARLRAHGPVPVAGTGRPHAEHVHGERRGWAGGPGVGAAVGDRAAGRDPVRLDALPLDAARVVADHESPLPADGRQGGGFVACSEIREHVEAAHVRRDVLRVAGWCRAADVERPVLAAQPALQHLQDSSRARTARDAGEDRGDVGVLHDGAALTRARVVHVRLRVPQLPVDRLRDCGGRGRPLLGLGPVAERGGQLGG